VHQIIQLPTAIAEKPSPDLFDRGYPAIRTDAVHVVFTSIDDSLAAVRVAHDLAKAVGVPLTLTHFRSVPYPVPVDAPDGLSPVETDAFVARLRAEGFNARVRVYLCRNERRAIPFAFKPHSLIVIAGRRSWWPTESGRWRRTLEAAGHFVVFVDTSAHVDTCDNKERVHA
jgi:hypothetical protein